MSGEKDGKGELKERKGRERDKGKVMERGEQKREKDTKKQE